MDNITKEPAQKDWFENGLMQRLPADIQDSFTQEQLNALKVAFGGENTL
ncbi:hypothetical protein ACMXYX_03330 [Neptuniibacter sp. QD72_48]